MDTLIRRVTASTVTITIGCMFVATVLWAIGGTIMASDKGAPPAFVTLGAAISLGLIAVAGFVKKSGRFQVRDFVLSRVNTRIVISLGVMEAVNVVCYYLALRMGPPALVASLHLMTPVFLGLYSIITRKSSVHWYLVPQMVLLIGVVYLMTGSRSTDKGPSQFSLADIGVSSALAITSAVLLAAINITIVKVNLTNKSATWLVSSQMWIGSAIVVPIYLIFFPIPSLTDVGVSLVVGMFFMAPALLFLWKALALGDVFLVSSLGLFEAIWTVILIAVVTFTLPSWQAVLSGVMILAVVFVQVRCGSTSTLSADEVDIH